jgi:hypothetical protein
LSFFEMNGYAAKMIFPCFYFLHSNNPTYPFITREGSQTLPDRKYLRVRSEDLFQIRWNFVDSALGEGGHEGIVTDDESLIFLFL